LAGCNGTSNSEINRWFDIPLVGTQGHEKVQSGGNEYIVFDNWLEHNPDRPVLLVDTINTLESGIPNAIKAFRKHWQDIITAGGNPAIRLDSGDLAYLAMVAVKMLDEAGLPEVAIVITNDIDEYVITEIKTQIRANAHQVALDGEYVLQRIASFPVGTKGATCFDQPALGGVAKIMEVAGLASIKLTENNPEKTSIPGNNSSAFIFRGEQLLGAVLFPVKTYQIKNGRFYKFGKAIDSMSVLHPHDGARQYTIERGDNIIPRQYMPYDGEWFTAEWENPTLDIIRKRIEDEVARLDWSHRRLVKSHEIKFSVVPEIYRLRQRMIKERVLREDWLT
jgi:nicotinate phosphoribosyltransferase